ncbi:MAG TPA: DUF1611 domain-containing protein [Anaerolineae bacterium]|nr:DUF1611 domain-containing protein [Anaerolineae bacterium]
MSERYLILTEGQTHPTPAKLAAGVLRYRPERVVALLDSAQAGRDAGELLGVGYGVPIVATIQDALPLKPTALVIGITPAGGRLPQDWRSTILTAMQHGLDVISGMHTLLGEDEELVAVAKKYGVRLVDLRKSPEVIDVNKCRAQKSATFRIHTVGTDCNCGKKVTALEIDRELRKRGRNTTFIATGQTGILIDGKGIAMDHVISDFVSGAAEKLVLENADYDYLVIEGQGSIVHPLYSGVTLSMLHGFAPQALILCHQPDRKIMRGTPDMPVPSLKLTLELVERIAAPVFPAKVVGISLNLSAFSHEQAGAEIDRVEKELGLPTTDVIRFGAQKLVDALLQFEKSLRSL